MRRVLILVLLYLGMQVVLPLRSGTPGAEALMTFGFLILGAYTVGELAEMVRAPKIVGYLAAGVLFGPAVLGLFTAEAATALAPVSEMAIALIAFLAGAELQWAELRERGVAILKLTSVELLLSFIGILGTLVALHGFLPFLAGAASTEVIAFGVLFAAAAIVHSPAVTMALLSETGARGPVARTTLGIVLLADVVVVVFFSGALALARHLVPPASGGVIAPWLVLWEIGGAVIVGAALGGAIAVVLRFAQRDLFIFALVIVFFGAELARLTHVESLLMLVVAGFVAENASQGRGQALRHAMERSAAPVFVVFFALAGAKITPSAVAELWLLVLPIVIVRAAAVWSGMRLGARWAGVGEAERRNAWLGLVSQAGVAIGLASIVANVYPSRGEQFRVLLLSVIAVNQFLGPVLFRHALARSGELAEGGGESESAPASAAPATKA